MPRGVTRDPNMYPPGTMAGRGKGKFMGAKYGAKGGVAQQKAKEKETKELKTHMKKKAEVSAMVKKKRYPVERLQGIIEGIVADKIVNKSEKPLYAVAKNRLIKKGEEPEFPEPKRTYHPPKITDENREEIRKVWDETFAKTSKQLDRKSRKRTATKTATKEPEPAPKKRPRKRGMPSAIGFENNEKGFDQYIRIALSNPHARWNVSVNWLNKSSTPDRHREKARKLFNWKKWWKIPVNPKTGQEYKQLNGGMDALFKFLGKTRAEVEEEYKRNKSAK